MHTAEDNEDRARAFGGSYGDTGGPFPARELTGAISEL